MLFCARTLVHRSGSIWRRVRYHRCVERRARDVPGNRRSARPQRRRQRCSALTFRTPRIGTFQLRRDCPVLGMRVSREEWYGQATDIWCGVRRWVTAALVLQRMRMTWRIIVCPNSLANRSLSWAPTAVVTRSDAVFCSSTRMCAWRAAVLSRRKSSTSRTARLT